MLTVGTKVNVKPEKGDKPEDCSGTISKVCKDGTYEVLFDNGDDGDKYTEADFVSIEVAEEKAETSPETPDDEFDGKDTPEPIKRALTPEELERKAGEARKANVDAKNKADAEKTAKQQADLADTPLTEAEVAFIARIRPRMNKGTHQPPPADILKYSQLIKREKV